MERQLGITRFGVTSTGQVVQCITIGGAGLTVSVLTWGAVVQGVWLDGVAHGLTLGSDRLADYEGAMRHHGSLIGPVVNRFTDAQARIGGRDLRFEANQDGRHCLHSGRAGTHLKVWRLAEVTEDMLRLELVLPDGEGGFPGNRRVAATWRVEGTSLHLQMQVTTDAVTPVNFANHSYWNLDGSESWAGHRLWIDAARYLPTTPDFTPTGEIAPVERGGMDFRVPRVVAPGAPAFDTCFCLGDGPGPLREVLRLTGQSGVTMAVSTTAPGVQVYDARQASRPGRAPYEGLAIEAQHWPDAPNHAGFPSIALEPGQDYRQHTVWRFSRG